MTPRLEIASRAMQAYYVPQAIVNGPRFWKCDEDLDSHENMARTCLHMADALLKAAESTPNESEMARTITRLEKRLVDVYQLCWEEYKMSGKEVFKRIAVAANPESAT